MEVFGGLYTVNGEQSHVSKSAQNCFLAIGSRHNKHIPMKFGVSARPCVYCLMSNFAWISKAALLQEPSECNNLVEIAICMLPVLQWLGDAYGF